jgi:hypothetical protein
MTDSTTAIMQTMASTIDGFLNGKQQPKRLGFVIMVFPFDAPEGARTNYVSNADREDMIVALKEVVARFEGRRQEGGNA